jgi:surface protein
MFSNATAFNNGGSDDIDNWTFSTISNINMSQMFGGTTTTLSCKFNRYIGSWNTQRVTNMSGMFFNNTAFDQNINTKTINAGLPNEYIAWDTSSVTTMAGMFRRATAFNQNIGNWDTSILLGMNNMFAESSFNQDISTKTINAGLPNEYIAWDVSNVQAMNDVFRSNSAFDKDISNWDTSSATTMALMFDNASAFDQNIGVWNTSNVTNMSRMVSNADAFDQDISNWDINQVDNFGNFMQSATGLSTVNYDLLLVGWEANLQALYPSGVGYPYTININFGGSACSPAVKAGARQSLIDNFGWTITDATP